MNHNSLGGLPWKIDILASHVRPVRHSLTYVSNWKNNDLLTNSKLVRMLSCTRTIGHSLTYDWKIGNL